MKHQTSKSILAFLVILVFTFSVYRVYASEVTGTLSTVPDANTTTQNGTNTTSATPTQSNALQGTVSGGTSVANAQDQYGNTQTDAAVDAQSGYTWAWIAITLVLLIGAIIYLYRRVPSAR